MLPAIFWILFAIAVAFVAWGFLRMFYEILRNALAERAPRRSGGVVSERHADGLSIGSFDSGSGFPAESTSGSSESSDASASGSDSSSSESSGGMESGGGDYGGGGASGGW